MGILQSWNNNYRFMEINGMKNLYLYKPKGILNIMVFQDIFMNYRLLCNDVRGGVINHGT